MVLALGLSGCLHLPCVDAGLERGGCEVLVSRGLCPFLALLGGQGGLGEHDVVVGLQIVLPEAGGHAVDVHNGLHGGEVEFQLTHRGVHCDVPVLDLALPHVVGQHQLAAVVKVLESLQGVKVMVKGQVFIQLYAVIEDLEASAVVGLPAFLFTQADVKCLKFQLRLRLCRWFHGFGFGVSLKCLARMRFWWG